MIFLHQVPPGKGGGLSPLTQLTRTYLGRPELGSFTLQKAYITFPLLSSSTISSRPPSAPGEKGEGAKDKQITHMWWERQSPPRLQPPGDYSC